MLATILSLRACVLPSTKLGERDVHNDSVVRGSYKPFLVSNPCALSFTFCESFMPLSHLDLFLNFALSSIFYKRFRISFFTYILLSLRH